MLGAEVGILLGVELGTEDGFEEPLGRTSEVIGDGARLLEALGVLLGGCRAWLRRRLRGAHRHSRSNRRRGQAPRSAWSRLLGVELGSEGGFKEPVGTSEAIGDGNMLGGSLKAGFPQVSGETSARRRRGFRVKTMRSWGLQPPKRRPEY
jgi:hypothetical protein